MDLQTIAGTGEMPATEPVSIADRTGKVPFLFPRAPHPHAILHRIRGAGPTTIYTLHALINLASCPFGLTIFEEQPTAGRGTPYRPGWNDPAMLSNIASIEIPPLEETLLDWLLAQPATRLVALGIDPEQIGERTFYPRLALGEFFFDQFGKLLERARSQGVEVTVRTRRVTDAVSQPGGMVLTVRPRHGDVFEERFDALECGQRDNGDVDTLIDCVVREAVTIDERQRRIRTQPAKAERRDPRGFSSRGRCRRGSRRGRFCGTRRFRQQCSGCTARFPTHASQCKRNSRRDEIRQGPPTVSTSAAIN